MWAFLQNLRTGLMGREKAQVEAPPLEDNFRFLFHENVGRVKGELQFQRALLGRASSL
jgi:hypothetical protein